MNVYLHISKEKKVEKVRLKKKFVFKDRVKSFKKSSKLNI